MKKLIIIILLLLCLTANVSHSQSFKMFGQIPSGQYAEGLVFFWRGIEAVEVVDESYYRRNMSLVNSPTWVGQGLDFERNNSELALTTTPILTTPPFTILAFVKIETLPSSYGSSKRFTAVGFGDTDTTHFFMLRADSTNNYVQMAIRAGGSIEFAEFTEAVVVGKWQMWGGISASSTSRFAILDGRISTEDTVSVAPTGIDNASMGMLKMGSSTFDAFDGVISHVLVYNRVLSASEIAQLNINPNLPMRQDPIWLLQPSVVPSGIIPIIQAHVRRRAG